MASLDRLGAAFTRYTGTGWRRPLLAVVGLLILIPLNWNDVKEFKRDSETVLETHAEGDGPGALVLSIVLRSACVVGGVWFLLFLQKRIYVAEARDLAVAQGKRERLLQERIDRQSRSGHRLEKKLREVMTDNEDLRLRIRIREGIIQSLSDTITRAPTDEFRSKFAVIPQEVTICQDGALGECVGIRCTVICRDFDGTELDCEIKWIRVTVHMEFPMQGAVPRHWQGGGEFKFPEVHGEGDERSLLLAIQAPATVIEEMRRPHAAMPRYPRARVSLVVQHGSQQRETAWRINNRETDYVIG